MNAFSHLEQYYVCKVLSLEIADQDKVDRNGHAIRKGDRYFICNYFKKKKERRGRIYYQLQNMEVYVLPQRVLSPFVTVEEENNELIMSAAVYQIICDEMM